MKKVYLFYMFFATLLFGGCKHDTAKTACELYVYMSSGKVYQISFNGKDSIETICGDMFKNYGMLHYHRPLPKGEYAFDSIYVKEKCKLPHELAGKILDTVKRLNSKIVTDTLEKGVKDVWEYSLFLPKQTISLELVKNKDEDVNSLLTKLIDNSPYYVNMECRIWFDQEYEDYLINKYGKRKLSLSSWD